MLGKHRAAKTGEQTATKELTATAANGCLDIHQWAFFSAGRGGCGDALLTAKKAMNPLHLITHFLGKMTFLKVQFKFVKFQKTEIVLEYVSEIKKDQAGIRTTFLAK